MYSAKKAVDYLTREPTWIVMLNGETTGYKICKDKSGFRIWGMSKRFRGLGEALNCVIEILTSNAVSS